MTTTTGEAVVRRDYGNKVALPAHLRLGVVEIRRPVDLLAGIAPYPGFLRRDGHSFFDGGGIMRANFRTDAVLERRDDFAARGVILRIRRENEIGRAHV